MADAEVEVCPECGSRAFDTRTGGMRQRRRQRGDPHHRYVCRRCPATFDEPEQAPRDPSGGLRGDSLAAKLDSADPDDLATDGGVQTDEPTHDPWELAELPPVDHANTDHDTDRMPTPDGAVRVYFNDELTYFLHDAEFGVALDAEPGETNGLTFRAPFAMFPDEEPPEPALWTDIDEAVPIREVETDDPTRRRWGPAEGVSWEFELVAEVEPYGGGE